MMSFFNKNLLLPQAIHTAAMEMLAGDATTSQNSSRKPEIVADAAYTIFTQEPKSTGQFFIDEELLSSVGVTDFTQYACNPNHKGGLVLDFFLPEKYFHEEESAMKIPDFGKERKDKEPAAGKAGFPDNMVGKIFTAIDARLSEQLTQATQAVFEFELTGEETGKWFIDLKNGKGSCGMGTAPTKPDAILKMDSKNFADMFGGKLKPATAYMMGKLKITGNLQKALKLEALMKSLKSKM